MLNIKSVMPALAVVGLASAAMMVPEMAMAQETIGSTATRVSENLQAMKDLAVNVGFFIGLVLAVVGLWLFYKDSTQPGQGHAKKGFIALIIGVLLLSLPWVIETTSSSVTGDGGTTEGRLKETF
jgi:flagellar basal body-associated protein FliL